MQEFRYFAVVSLASRHSMNVLDKPQKLAPLLQVDLLKGLTELIVHKQPSLLSV